MRQTRPRSGRTRHDLDAVLRPGAARERQPSSMPSGTRTSVIIGTACARRRRAPAMTSRPARSARPAVDGVPSVLRALVDHEAQCFVGGRQHRHRQARGSAASCSIPLFRESRQVEVQALRATRRAASALRNRLRTPPAPVQRTPQHFCRPPPPRRATSHRSRPGIRRCSRPRRPERARRCAACAANGVERLQDAPRRVGVYDGHDSGRGCARILAAMSSLSTG